MTEQPDSLKIADRVDDIGPDAWTEAASDGADEIRRLYAVNQELLAACKAVMAYSANDSTDGFAMMLAYDTAMTAVRDAITKATGIKP